MKTEQTKNLEIAIATTLINNPDKWGSSDWELVIFADLSVDIYHSTDGKTGLSLYGLDLDGWFDTDEAREIYIFCCPKSEAIYNLITQGISASFINDFLAEEKK